MIEKKTYYEDQKRSEKELYDRLHSDKGGLLTRFTKERNELED